MLDAEELNAMQDRAKRAHDHVCDIASGKARWKMSIPANEETDSDLLLSASVTDVPLLAQEIERLKAELAERDSDPNDIVLPSLAKPLCNDLHTEPGMKGFYLCRLDPGHDQDHASGSKTWPLDQPSVSVPTHHTQED